LKWPGVDEAAQGWIFEPRRLLDGLLPARPVAGGHEGLEYQNMVGAPALNPGPHGPELTDAAGDEQEIGYIGLMSWK